jgi:hypothetical protein
MSLSVLASGREEREETHIIANVSACQPTTMGIRAPKQKHLFAFHTIIMQRGLMCSKKVCAKARTGPWASGG